MFCIRKESRDWAPVPESVLTPNQGLIRRNQIEILLTPKDVDLLV